MKTMKVYFGNLPLIISGEAGNTTAGHRAATASEALSMIKNSNSDKPIMVKTEDLRTAKDEIFKDFEVIQAGGGLVQNEEGRYLLIYRRGHWDLPKGKLDEGESIEQCAVREVMEETGLNKLTIIQPLPPSYHVYRQNGVDILKETHWYLMRHQGNSELLLQSDEDIEDGKWLSREEMDDYFPQMYPLIRDLIQASDV